MANAKIPGDPPLDARQLEGLALEAASGKDACFARLAAHFAPYLTRVVSSLPVPPEEKEDLCQEGLIGLYKAVRLFDPALSSFSTFARLCIRSGVLDGYRAFRKTGGANMTFLEEDDLLPASDSQSPERVLVGKEELSSTLRRIDLALSPLEKRVFSLRLQGETPMRIASLLGLSRKSVDNASFRVQKKIASLSWNS